MLRVNAPVAYWTIGEKHIGGSRSAAVCGKNVHQSVYATVMELRFNKKPKFTQKTIDKMWLGTYLEPGIVLKVEQRINRQVFTPEVTFVDEDYRYLIAHIDGCFIDENGDQVLVECKYSEHGFNEIWIL